MLTGANNPGSGFITASVDNANVSDNANDPKCPLATCEWLQGPGKWSLVSENNVTWVERGGGVLCEENIMQLTADITPHSSGVLVDLW